jgi:hypothetical protein
MLLYTDTGEAMDDATVALAAALLSFLLSIFLAAIFAAAVMTTM